MTTRLLICTDLDRTLLPNGNQPESPTARHRFAKLCARPEVSLAFVSGRHRKLVLDAIDEYQIPVPNFVIGDVGTNIYTVQDDHWQTWQTWYDEIAPDWGGLQHEDLKALLADLETLQLQEEEKQNRFKLSYYASHDTDTQEVLGEMKRRLNAHYVKANLIWSVDETIPIGLVDVLPASASKLHAVELLMQQQNFSRHNTVFAGDSGNDLPVLVSPVHSVLVANAIPEVREQALKLASEQGSLDALYLARGDFWDMNGNYSAGILEGLAHYMPETKHWWS